MSTLAARPNLVPEKKADADYVFYELTRSLCPECRRVIDAQIVLRDDRVFMRKRCPDHGWFEALVYGDAQAYTAQARYNKPGTIPLQFSTAIAHGCPHDCGLCPDHQQHVCVGIIEINTACNMDCPLCFADAGAGYNMTLSEVESILDHLVTTEGSPEVVQFSGGEPTIHPELIPMLKAAAERQIAHVMINTNGRRIAHDDDFLAELAELKPAVYFQFDGFRPETYRLIRGEADLLEEKIRALDRLAAANVPVILVPAIEQDINLDEVGQIVKFGLEHPAVFGVNFQPAFHAGRHLPHDPLRRLTIPDLIQALEAQTQGLFVASDFVPVPCCFPTCNSVTYAYVEEDNVLPLTRIVDVDEYLDYITNRDMPNWNESLKTTLERLWSSSAIPGTPRSTSDFECAWASSRRYEIGISVPTSSWPSGAGTTTRKLRT